jgi:hypothetical protein
MTYKTPLGHFLMWLPLVVVIGGLVALFPSTLGLAIVVLAVFGVLALMWGCVWVGMNLVDTDTK